MDNEKKILLENELQQVIQINDNYFIIDKKDKICILPYTINVVNGILDKLGIIEDWNYVEKEKTLTLINDYIRTDDDTDLLAANRIFFEKTGFNVTNANLWMYIGSLYNNMSADSPIKIYAVDVTKTNIESIKNNKFKLMDSSRVIQTNDMLFLATYTRLFQYFYTQSLNKYK